ncbi:MAG: hypothetical protein DYH12_34250, partial [Sorangiineae bacterium PRO1]|nr:hypothetical protein [Sorangiineae bacterium PRO1]
PPVPPAPARPPAERAERSERPDRPERPRFDERGGRRVRSRDRDRDQDHEPFRYSVESAEPTPAAADKQPDTDPGRAADTGGSAETEELRRDEALSEIFVNVGRRDGATPADFHAVLEGGGLPADATDYVRVRHRHAFVGTRKELLERVLQVLNGASIAGRTAAAEIARPRT